MNESTITTSLDDRGVATVTLNRPEKHNAFDDTTIAELKTAFDEIAQDDQARIMVLASEGKIFSAGADIGWMKRMSNYSYGENLRDANALAEMLASLNFMPKPTIARVQGPAFGGAVGMVSCCDMAVASCDASFSFSEVKLGLAPATISPYVVAAIGERAARCYFQTGECFSAETAHRLGLVTHLEDEAGLDEILNRLIDQLLTNGPQAVKSAKQLVFDVAGRVNDDDLKGRTSELIATLRASQEGQEGLNAFLEKRKPAWIKDK